jgi:signal transduction histidine kinase
MSTTDRHDRRSFHKRTAARTAVFYAIFACLWIYFSDTILALFISDTIQLTKAQSIKGWLFVLVTAILLFFYISHSLQLLREREEEIDRGREQTKRELQDRFKELNTLFDAMNAVVYVADIATYELLYVNRFAAEAFGPDWKGAKCYHYLQEGSEQPCDFCTNQQLIRNGETGGTVCWEFLNTKNNHWYECFDKAIRWTDGRLVRLEIALDITERKELETIKDDLLSSMSHEMRTPLTAIRGFAELLENEPDLSEQHRRHIEIIGREAETLTELVDRFLDVRRLKTNRSRTGYELLPIQGPLIKAKERCRDCKEHHDIQIECPSDLQVYGNSQELSQVITQLLDNACRYSPEGGLISLTAQADTDGTSIRVSDQGIGIPQHELEAIFDPFHKLDTGDRRSTRGVGLGLCVAKDIIALHGGKMHAESTPGQGSTFTILLPSPINRVSQLSEDSSGTSQS